MDFNYPSQSVRQGVASLKLIIILIANHYHSQYRFNASNGDAANFESVADDCSDARIRLLDCANAHG